MVAGSCLPHAARLPPPLRSFLVSGTFPHTFMYLSGLLTSVAYIPIAFTLPCLFSLKLLVGGRCRRGGGAGTALPEGVPGSLAVCNSLARHCLAAEQPDHSVGVHSVDLGDPRVCSRVAGGLLGLLLPPGAQVGQCRPRGQLGMQPAAVRIALQWNKGSVRMTGL